MKKLLYFISLIIATSCCFSCNETEESAPQEDSTALRIAVLPSYECLPFYYADSLGLFDSLGVSVKLITFDAAMDADTAFVNGDVDGIVSDLIKASIWRGNGDSVKVVMGGDIKMYLITAQNARIMKAESMKEKIIGITRFSCVDYFTDKILESVKLTPTDLNKPQINNLVLRCQMVDQNQYDGAIMTEPYASEAVARGARRLNCSTDMNMPLMAFVFTDSTTAARKSDIQKVIKAYDMAVESLNNDTLITNVLSFIPKEHTVYLPDTLFTPYKLGKAELPRKEVLQNVQKWTTTKKWVGEKKAIQLRAVDFSELIDSTFIK